VIDVPSAIMSHRREPDRTSGITGSICSQVLPFVPPEAPSMYVNFEHALYGAL
jgi:hypothetical protein